MPAAPGSPPASRPSQATTLTKLLLINPNTNAATTASMAAIASEAAQGRAEIDGATVGYGPPVVFDAATLETAAEAVLDLAADTDLAPYSGLIVGGFGDPGLEQLRARMAIRATGIAEAAILEAAAGGRRFSIVITQPLLVPAINARVSGYGHASRFAGVRLTAGDPGHILNDPAALRTAILDACDAAIRQGGAEAVIIGGGPSAVTARTLRSQLPVPVIEPIPAATRLALARAGITPQ